MCLALLHKNEIPVLCCCMRLGWWRGGMAWHFTSFVWELETKGTFSLVVPWMKLAWNIAFLHPWTCTVFLHEIVLVEGCCGMGFLALRQGAFSLVVAWLKLTQNLA